MFNANVFVVDLGEHIQHVQSVAPWVDGIPLSYHQAYAIVKAIHDEVYSNIFTWNRLPNIIDESFEAIYPPESLYEYVQMGDGSLEKVQSSWLASIYLNVVDPIMLKIDEEVSRGVITRRFNRWEFAYIANAVTYRMTSDKPVVDNEPKTIVRSDFDKANRTAMSIINRQEKLVKRVDHDYHLGNGEDIRFHNFVAELVNTTPPNSEVNIRLNHHHQLNPSLLIKFIRDSFNTYNPTVDVKIVTGIAQPSPEELARQAINNDGKFQRAIRDFQLTGKNNWYNLSTQQTPEEIEEVESYVEQVVVKRDRPEMNAPALGWVVTGLRNLANTLVIKNQFGYEEHYMMLSLAPYLALEKGDESPIKEDELVLFNKSISDIDPDALFWYRLIMKEIKLLVYRNGEVNTNPKMLVIPPSQLSVQAIKFLINDVLQEMIETKEFSNDSFMRCAYIDPRLVMAIDDDPTPPDEVAAMFGCIKIKPAPDKPFVYIQLTTPKMYLRLQRALMSL